MENVLLNRTITCPNGLRCRIVAVNVRRSEVTLDTGDVVPYSALVWLPITSDGLRFAASVKLPEWATEKR